MIRTIVALLLLSGAVQADTLYRCVGKGGAVAYQDRPCGPRATQTGTTAFTPERVPVYRPPRLPQPSVRPLRESRRSGGGTASGAHIPIESASRGCEAAKSRREKTLSRVGLKRDFKLLQTLDEVVRGACR